MHAYLIHAFIFLGIVAGSALGQVPTQLSPMQRPRIITTTDLGADPDDEQSLVRLFVCANEFEIEGLIVSTGCWKKSQQDTSMLDKLVDAYAECYDNLSVHARGFPTADYLRSISVMGQTGYGMEDVGDGKDSAGSDLIIQSIDKDDRRPVWVGCWGGANCVAQAILKVSKTRSEAELRQFLSKLRVFDVLGQDDAGAWIAKNYPQVFYIRATGVYGWQPPKNGAYQRDDIQSHGPLGKAYPDTKWASEGDTPAFMHVYPNGLNDPEKIDQGSWGGRFSPKKIASIKSMKAVKEEERVIDPYLMFGNTEEGSRAISKWSEGYNNDFAARMDWSIASDYSKANHHPIAVVNGDATKRVLEIAVEAGTSVKLSAEGSSDPDKNELIYDWMYYEEPSTWGRPVTIEDSDTATPSVIIPEDAGGESIHIILQLHDGGEPSLYAYRRVILNIKDSSTVRGKVDSQRGNLSNKAASAIPLVYEEENSGDQFTKPALPEIDELPEVLHLPDPFAWSDGSGRVTSFQDWSKRRSEIKAEIERYGVGERPPQPQEVTAKFVNDQLIVQVTEKNETLTLHASVELPEGNGPFPAVIGIGFGGGAGSLPKEIFAKRKIATIAFNFAEIMAHQQKRGEEPINRLYPQLAHIGAYSAWPWGISRIIDGLELTKSELPIDRSRLAVTGCSFAGKMALFAGAFDERVALTIAQEPGGGGAAAWRVSETLGNVETLGKTSRAWFREEMFDFASAVNRLPYDHHELMALVAPRALLVLGNPDYEWLAEESTYVSCRAAHEVWKSFGIGDRFGFSIVAGHQHCQLPDNQLPEVEAFIDRFLLGRETTTAVAKHPFEDLEYQYWYDAWAKGKSTFPRLNEGEHDTQQFVAESKSPGSDWITEKDPDASGGSYVTVLPQLDSPQVVPSEASAEICIPFSTSKNSKYYIYARVKCPSPDDDSFWLQIDDGPFAAINGLTTSSWKWVKLTAKSLPAGTHELTIKYRENGALLDKIGITTFPLGAQVFKKNSQDIALKDAVKDRFKIGVGVGHSVLKNEEDVDLINEHFQILTPENCMKPQGIHPAEDKWRFQQTDAFADFARANNLEMVGHCLVWAKDDRTDQWMMIDGDKPVSRAKLLSRINDHVSTVVKRYADVASHWDVVNEAIGDSNDGLLRDSVYSRTTGIDFIVTAFKAARAHDPDALLIYNDYNGHKPAKRKKLLELLTKLRAAGAPVDAYGMQGHFELGDNSLSELRDTFEALRKLNVKVVVSELDIDVVKRGRWWAEGGKYRDELKDYNPYPTSMPAAIEKQMNAQYSDLFELFVEYSDTIERVSFWNLHDGQSWLNYFPWNRVNHPLLFDRERKTKPAFDAVMRVLTAKRVQADAAEHAALRREDANSVEAHRQLLKKLKAGKIDVYFQGDSITRRWGATDYPKLLEHWAKTFHGWNAANFAWGGDSTHNMLWRMRNGELEGVAPKVICLQAGANNLPWRGPASKSQEKATVEGIKAIIAEFNEKLPAVPIVLTAMFPRDQNPELAGAIRSINKELKQFCEDRQDVKWVNINQQLVDSAGRLKPGVSKDGLHLELAGYKVWGNALTAELEQLLGQPAETDQAPPATGNPGL